ncbi:MAG: UDP-glucose/GDP-mannose dehydrogenase family protein [Actinomycetia bacterium]|nr:UDP-glucose/GDP-mannose dehydrogenase family protein [Actinomycetes bacterium]
MNITIIGTGYVGLVTGACLSDLGHTVRCLDVDEKKIELLNKGVVPIYEPGLEELIIRNTAASRLRFTTNYEEAIPQSDAVFVAVGTPSSNTGEADLSYVDSAIETMAPLLAEGTTVVMKSTVPVGTTRSMRDKLTTLRPDAGISVGSNPEFLKQGAAVQDFMHPDRIVVGAQDAQAEKALREVYQPLLHLGANSVFTDLATAELIKYASNAFLAVKLSFINEIADLCEQTDASITDIAIGMGMDARISDSFLNAGPGYGGSCFPKDTQALLHTSHVHGASSRIVASAVDVNRNRKAQMIERVVRILGGDVSGKRIGALGLTFKANTDDLRESPAIDIIRGLVGHGAIVRAYDPQGIENARPLLPGVEFVDGPYETVVDAEALVILTEWPEFASLDLARVKEMAATPTIIDFRNLYDVQYVADAGLSYHSVGRASGNV